MSIIEREQTVDVEAPAVPDAVVIPKTPPEAQILETAADILETEGWVRGSYAAWGHGRCAVGGIGAAMQRLTFNRGEKAKSRRAAEQMLAELVLASEPRANYHDVTPEKTNKGTIIRWNDWYASQGKVIRLMREAAARLTPKL